MKKIQLLIAFIPCIIFTHCKLISYAKYVKATKIEHNENAKVFDINFIETIPFRYEKGFILLNITIEKVEKNFIFDTGATTLLDAKIAKTIQTKRIGRQKHHDSTGKTRTLKIVTLPKITLGDTDFKSVIANITDLTPLCSQLGFDFDGILGVNVMNHGVWQIDYGKQLITFCNSQEDLPQRTIESTPKTFNFYSEGKGTPKISLYSYGQYLGEAELDTGSNGGIAFPSITQKLLPDTCVFTKKESIAGGLFAKVNTKSSSTKVSALLLGQKVEIKDVPLSFEEHLPFPLIGNKSLSQFIVTIDWKRKEIILTKCP
jgi:Aspartyl protease